MVRAVPRDRRSPRFRSSTGGRGGSRVSLFGSFEVGRRSLLSHQWVLDTIGHNLANVGTRGYTRQRAELTPFPWGGGVEVARVIRVRDQFLDAMLLEQTGAAGL